jgi:hypothetical protein
MEDSQDTVNGWRCPTEHAAQPSTPPARDAEVGGPSRV